MIKPCGFRVVVRPDALVEKTASGIVVAYENKDREQAAVQCGELVFIGPTAWKDYGDAPWARAGDRVTFSRYAGRFIEDPDDPDTRYVLLNDEDILAVLTKKETVDV